MLRRGFDRSNAVGGGDNGVHALVLEKLLHHSAASRPPSSMQKGAFGVIAADRE